MLQGYLHQMYASAMAMGGRPVALAKSTGWLIIRRIPGSELEDAIAPYPFLVCRDWLSLKYDIENMNDKLVSVTAVTDPLADVDVGTLHGSFGHVRPFKEHFVIDCRRPVGSFVDPHHRGCARRALKKIIVERCQVPLIYIDEWLDLYANLVRRHGISGSARITEQSFRKQFQVPGLSMFRACRDGAVVGIILCMADGEKAYFHLGAYNELGYRSKASYALVWSIIEHFSEARIKILSIGGAARAFDDGQGGLTRFKRGWASGTRMTYICGSILDRRNYQALAVAAPPNCASYFPIYRAGEFS